MVNIKTTFEIREYFYNEYIKKLEKKKKSFNNDCEKYPFLKKQSFDKLFDKNILKNLLQINNNLFI